MTVGPYNKNKPRGAFGLWRASGSESLPKWAASIEVTTDQLRRGKLVQATVYYGSHVSTVLDACSTLAQRYEQKHTWFRIRVWSWAVVDWFCQWTYVSSSKAESSALK